MNLAYGNAWFEEHVILLWSHWRRFNPRQQKGESWFVHFRRDSSAALFPQRTAGNTGLTNTDQSINR